MVAAACWSVGVESNMGQAFTNFRLVFGINETYVIASVFFCLAENDIIYFRPFIPRSHCPVLASRATHARKYLTGRSSFVASSRGIVFPKSRESMPLWFDAFCILINYP